MRFNPCIVRFKLNKSFSKLGRVHTGDKPYTFDKFANVGLTRQPDKYKTDNVDKKTHEHEEEYAIGTTSADYAGNPKSRLLMIPKRNKRMEI